MAEVIRRAALQGKGPIPPSRPSRSPCVAGFDCSLAVDDRICQERGAAAVNTAGFDLLRPLLGEGWIPVSLPPPMPFRQEFSDAYSEPEACWTIPSIKLGEIG